MDTSNRKGADLEHAVRQIEETILSSVPGYNEKTFTIESRKRVVVDGVRHEIDLWVDVDLGHGYKAIFIFECKNWEEPVGKNEIIVFSEKIAAVQAQKGFFVAPEFTADARAQAKKDPRIQLITAIQHPLDLIPGRFHVVSIEGQEQELHYTTYTDPKALIDCRPDGISAVLQNVEIKYYEYLNEWMGEIRDLAIREFPSQDLPDGEFRVTSRNARQFASGELFLNEVSIQRIELVCHVMVRITRQKVISHYEVASRGRVVKFEPIPIGVGGGTITPTGVTVVESSSPRSTPAA